MRGLLFALLSAIVPCTLTAQTTIFSEDFEGGTLGAFTNSNTVTTLSWNNTTIRGTEPGHSSSRSAYFGNPADTSYNTGAAEGALITTGAIDLSSYDNAILRFNYFLESEQFDGYDIAQVSISTDGVTFDSIVDNQAGLGNVFDAIGSWQTRAVNISSYVGNATVYIRFSFNTVDNFSNTFEGFYIDDIIIYDLPALIGEKAIGGVSNDEPYDLEVTSDGGYVIVGGSFSYGTAFQDIYLLKLDVQGDTMWTKAYSESFNELGYSILESRDGGYIIGSNIALIKTDSRGDTLWTKQISSRSVEQTSDGGYIAAKNLGLVKMNSAGDTTWSKRYTLTSSDLAFSVKQINGGGYILTGHRDDVDMVLIKTNTTGDITWAKTYGGSGLGTDIGYEVLQTVDDGFMVVGVTSSFGTWDIYAVRTDSNGVVLWSKTYGGPGFDFGYSVQQTADGGFIIAGSTTSFGPGNGDAYLLKIDMFGNLQWSKAFGASSTEEYCNEVRINATGGYIIAGVASGFGSGGKDIYLINTDANGNTGCNQTTANTVVTNPATVQAFVSPTVTTGILMFAYNLIPSGAGGVSDTICDILPPVAATDSIKFQKTYGGSVDDIWDPVLGMNTVEQTSDGGYIVLSSTGSFGQGGADVYLTKTDVLGNVEWSKTYGHPSGDDVGYSVKQTNDGGYIVCGYYRDISDKDVYLIRTDASGDTLWTRRYGSNFDDLGYSIAVTFDNKYVICGRSEGYGGGMYMLKVDDSGDTLWTKSIVLGSSAHGYSITMAMDGGYVVAGFSDICFGKVAYLVKVDVNGTVVWLKDYEGVCGFVETMKGYSVSPTADGGYILTGQTNAYGAGNLDVLLIKTNATGDVQWSKSYGGALDDYGSYVSQTSDGGYIITGYSVNFAGGGDDVYLIRTNATGDTLWTKVYGSAFSDIGYTVKQTTDGGFVIGAMTSGFGAGATDVYLIKTDANGNSGACFEYPTSTITTVGVPNEFSYAGSYNPSPGNILSTISIPGTAATQVSTLSLETDITITSVNCNGGNNGGADLELSGGISPMTYSWSNGPTTEDLVNVAAGPYYVTVTDGNGCTVDDSTVVTEPTLLTTTIAPSHVKCYGGNDGTASAIPSGGTLPYNYMWNTGQTDSTAIGLFPGNYSVNVFDVNGCLANNIITITQPSALITSISGTDVTCIGGATGSADQTVTGGTLPYTYLWSNATTTEDLSSIIAGTYTVTVTDSCGITTIDSIIINEPPGLSTTIVAIDISCNGFGDGSADLSVSGGTLPYTYSWSNAATTEDISGLVQGNFIVTATDNCGIFISDTAVINEPAVLTTTISKTDASCFSGGDGTATVTPTGGTAPYNYLWNIGQTDSTAIGLFAGTYGVNIVDANGCLASNTIIVNQPGALSIGLIGTAVTCNAGSDGTANPNVSGGTTPYTYAWSNSATTPVLIGISAGVYTVTVTDACNAVLVDSVSISEPSAMTSTTSTSSISCNGSTDGAIDLSVTGGTQPYTYSWSSGPTTEDLANLDTGTFVVGITDACTATFTDTAVISEPQVLTTSMTSTDVECFGGGNGTATVTTTGGTAPYNYLWNNGQTNSTSIGLFPNNYTVNVTDSNGCLTSDIVSIIQPTQLSATFASTDVSCLVGNNGTSTATPSGGTLPYSYIWSVSGDTTALSSGLVEGTYAVTVTDSCGATIIDSVAVGGPGSLSTSIIGTNVSCFGFGDGSLDLSVSSGSSPYAYLWSNGDTTKDLSSLSIGTYSVTVTDSCGTVIIDSLTITEPTLLTSTISGTNINCNGNGDGTATVLALGGTTPYFYQWNNNQTVPAMIGLFQGNYTVNVTDANGCLTSNNITITEPPALTQSISVVNASCGNADGSASSIASGGVTPYTYSWSGGGSSSTDTSLIGGSYSIFLTDSNGCMDSTAVTIPISAVPQDICMITVDSTSALNVVVWEKAVATNIDSFKIYRDVVGVYAHIGSLPYAAESNYYDSTSGINPNITSYRYKISTLDVCGNESPLSDYHETIHVQTIKNGGVVDMSWDNYEGFGFAYYRILRDSTGLGGFNWIAHDSVTAANFTYTDINPPNATTDYTIEVVHPAGCVANKQKNWNASKSNTSTTIGTGGTILATTSSTNASFGSCDGTATVTPTSGTPAYTYLWDGSAGFQNTSTAGGLCPGNYAVTVTDALGATYSATVAVGEDGGTLLSATTSATPANADTCNGTAVVSASGGVPAYSYQWDGNANDQTADTATGLCNGTYSVVITDSTGNSVTVFATVETIPGMTNLTEETMKFKAFPNPFNGVTNISYDLSDQHHVRLELFNILGELIATIEDALLPSGEYLYQLNAAALNMSPGVYRIRLTLDNKITFTKQLIR